MLQFTTLTFFWLLGCLALGVVYAFLLYGNSTTLNLRFRNSLFALRTLAVALLAFLLFTPLLKIANKVAEKPLIIIAQDNSASIGISEPPGFRAAKYQSDLEQAVKALSADYDVRTFHFGGEMGAGLDFNYKQKLTDLSAVFKNINNQFANRNIGAIVMATDGIYNRGGNPEYEAVNIKSPVYSIALGDTIPRRDMLIANVNYNNIVYLGNQYQLEVSVEAYQCRGAATLLTVSDRSGTLFSKPVQINSDEFRTTVPVTLLAGKKGIQALTIKLAPVKNELSLLNNQQSVFIDVLDGKEKVLIVANSPHPDLSALKQAIETNKNYEVTVALIDEVKPADVQDASLVILHQLPSATNKATELLKLAANKSLLYVVGTQTNTAALSGLQSALKIVASGQAQEVTAHVKPDFYSFTLGDITKSRLIGFAPLVAPFGAYSLKGPATILLNQQIGKVATENPMLLFADEPQRKIGILVGEGIWRWRLDDFNDNGNHEATDELINKTVQYLSAKEDKRKFRVYPARRSFDENERVILDGELYNDAYELVNTPDVNVVLKNGNGNSYTFLFSKTSNAYELDAGLLPPGDYSFLASTRMGKVSYTSSGQFIISQEQAEFQHTTANHQLLYDLAKQSNGRRIYPAEVSSLPQLIKTNDQVKTISYENRRYEDLINLKLLFFVILTLLSVEWFSRKRSGEV